MSRSTRCQVLIVDDHPIVCRGLRAALEVDGALSVVGVASTCREALDRLAELDVDVALVDIMLPDGSGFDLARLVKLHRPLCKVLMVSAQDAQTCAGWALQSGADGFVSKTAEPHVIREHVMRVWRKELAFPASVLEQALRSLQGAQGDGIQQLTAREFEVLFLLGWGLNSKEIAAQLEVSQRTIETYHGRLRAKLAVPHHDALIRLATLIFAVNNDNALEVQRDMALLRAFETRALEPADWDHRAHLRVAFCYLSRRPYGVALRCLEEGIPRLNEAHGRPDAYHATITVAWARVLRALLEAEPMWLHSAGFLAAHPALADDAITPLLEHYSRERLMSAEARARFIEPDRAPLPG